MSKIDDSADQVLGLAERFRGLLDVAEVIKSIGSLDQAVIERQAALADITQQHDAAKAELITAQAELKAFRETQASELAQHQKACAALSETANAEAAGVVHQANNDAAEILAAAQGSVTVIQQAHDAAIAAKRADLADLQSRIDSATASLADITASHDAMALRIEALKATAKSVLGD